VEFLFDVDRGDFFFLEVNARLQVEHGVTEEVTGLDLVEWMLRGAAGDFAFMHTPAPQGVAIQARLYAEDPAQDFRPCSGTIIEAAFPESARVETWVESGAEISAYYDSMLAKIIVRAPDRASAVAALAKALNHTRIAGIETNLDWLRAALANSDVQNGAVTTASAAEIAPPARGLRVISGGPAASVQDYPGRLGFWDVGAPPSGPMDARSFRLGNALLGNAEGAPGIEFAGMGPTLLFQEDARFCLTGAAFHAELDGAPVAPHRTTQVHAGQTLKIGRVNGPGLRGYLLIAGGIDAPNYLGSASCFTLGGFGGHAGRALAAGDVLRIAHRSAQGALASIEPPTLSHDWTLRVRAGPHGALDFFTQADIDTILAASWKVHYNSSRTGVRLIGPKPHWARRDGGEAGLHPSNIHDNAYAIGAVDFTGDMPIILGPDGPSLGGFVCPFVVAKDDLWKLGQLAPGDSVRFELAPGDASRAQTDPRDPILHQMPSAGARPRIVYRRQGDSNILVEYGDIVLDLELRARVHALLLELRKLALPGIIDITPGIRSLQLHFDSERLPQSKLLDALISAEERLGALEEFEAPSRIVHLPLSWDDPAIHETIEKYQQSVRADAPWAPSNIEFIRRVNGLDSIDDVRRIVFDASYLVMGLGDVYLGAPVATPLDPRHRLVTTKYNPARTWTPPNVVGIGGAYLCIYGMEGPGGYQLFGRTIQVWNTYRQTGAFEPGKPWLLRFFDQIRFFPVSHEELCGWRRDFPAGLRNIKIEPATFRLSEYRAFLADNASSIAAFQQRREAAFAAEREQWRRDGEFARAEALSAESETVAPAADLDPAWDLVEAPLGGSVWRILVEEGARVKAGEIVAVVEAMKTECDVASSSAGVVRRIIAVERQAVAPGAPLIAIEPEATS
jgi:urea carboxylase